MSLLWVTAAKPIPTKGENLDEWVSRARSHWLTQLRGLPHEQTLDEFSEHPGVFWHGSPNGVAGMKQAHYGVHVGTQEAARQALEARIGRRADGQDWDGTQEYGKTLLGGYDHGYGSTEPANRYPSGRAEYSDGTKIPMDAKPNLFPVHIVGGMTNEPHSAHPDWHANGYMQAQIKQGRARNGYYYRNEAEDSGSISAVVPSADHLATHEDFVRHAHANPWVQGWDRPIHPDNLERYGLS